MRKKLFLVKAELSPIMYDDSLASFVNLTLEALEKNYQKSIEEIIKEFRKVRNKSAPDYFQEDVRLLAKIAIRVFIKKLEKLL